MTAVIDSHDDSVLPTDSPDDIAAANDAAVDVTPKKRGRGRPRKGEIVAKKKGNRGVIGRPPGDAAIMADYKARMLASPKSASVLSKLFDIALNDDHKGQIAAIKIVSDRLLPLSSFEVEKNSKGVSGITINVNTTGPEISIDGEVIEHE